MIHFLRQILLKYFRPYWKKCLLLFVCMLALIAFDTIFPLGIKFLIDLAIVPNDLRMFGLLAAGLAGLYLVSAAGSLGEDYLDAWVTTRVMNDLRMAMFARLHDLTAGYYAKLDSGDVITRFSVDLAAVEYALAWSVVSGFQAVLQLALSLVVLFMLDVKLGLVTLLVMPLTAVFPKRLVGKASEQMELRRVEEDGIIGAVQDNLQAYAVNRVFGLRRHSIDAFERRLEQFAHIATRSAFSGWMVSRTTNLGQFLIQLLVVVIGAYLALTGQLSVSSLVGFTALLGSVGYSIALVSASFAGLVPAAASLKRIEGLLEESPRAADDAGAPLPRLAREIRFEDVGFSYAGPGGKPNLDGMSFSIPHGQSAAFVGRSGSGKSTVLNLLMRFYDPLSGRIQIDDHDLQTVSQESLRAQMGVVFQDTFLFNTSLRENIRLGKLGASDAEVEEAARAAGIHEDILKMPWGYDTMAGERGKALSGGQRQRIALARALLRRPAILLLDEATSALDPQTEMQIYDTLKKLQGACTVLSVTHRLAPIAYMDQIVAVDQGRVVEAGTHAGLMDRQGLYYQLASQQSGFSVSPDGTSAEVTPARLRSLPLFEKLDDASLAGLALHFSSERCEAGQTVIREGEMGDRFYIIVRGKVAVSYLGAGGQPVELPGLQDGDHFGEIALLEKAPRTATIRALTPSLFLTLERKHFMNMLAAHPEIRAAVDESARVRMEASRSRGMGCRGVGVSEMGR